MPEEPRKKGLLIMAATHLGRPEDLPARSLDALRTADLLVFEEDRPARGFLKAAGVHRDYLKYSEHAQQATLDAVSKALQRGASVVYMSDQGTPGLADPGRDLTALAYRLGAAVTSIPGPSALAAAVAACPFDCRSFFFLGLPPREPGARLAALKAHATAPVPTVIMDTPYRLLSVLESCAQAFGGSRRALLALAISGAHEEFRVEPLDALRRFADELEDKRNFVLIVDGRR